MPVADYNIYCQMLDRPGNFICLPGHQYHLPNYANAVLKGLRKAKVMALFRFHGGQRLRPGSNKDMASGQFP